MSNNNLLLSKNKIKGVKIKMRVIPKFKEPKRVNFQIEKEKYERFKEDAKAEGFKTVSDYLNKIISIVLGDEN